MGLARQVSKGRAAIKSFVVEKGTPGMVVERLEHKLGIRASDTATIRFTDCRVPKENLLGSPDVEAEQGFAGVMQTFDNTRPLVAGDGGRLRARRAGRDRVTCSPRRASRSTTTGRPTPSSGRCGAVADGGGLGGGLPADHGGRLDGRQQQAELAAGVDGQGEGGPGRRGDHAASASSWPARSATASGRCWRSGRATRRSSTSSRGRSRSSS